MQLSGYALCLVLLTMLLSRPGLAHCPVGPERTVRSGGFAGDWQLVQDIGDEREISRMPDVVERIVALESGGTAEEPAPERIALQVAMMDRLALLEWLAARDAGAGESPAYEWQYIEQHSHRGIQRQKVQAGLEAHPGDPHLAGVMVSLQGFDPQFYREQLELAVRRDPSLDHLREHLAHFLLFNEGLEPAQRHIVALLSHASSCAGEEDPRIPWALAVLGWLQEHPDRCMDLQVQAREQISNLLGEMKPMSGDVTLTLIRNRLLQSPELVEPLLHAMSEVLAGNGCQSG